MNWAKGQQLQNGKYVIEKELGRGGFGITYKARHTFLNYDVVIKTPNEDVKSDPDYAKYVKRFIKEGEMLAQLSNDPHPHIVRISDLFQEGDTHCLVMDFIPGESLWHFVGRTGALSETEAVEYIRQIGSALSVVHQKQLVHLDVTPPNIMVRNNGKAVLIDFGIAADMSPPSTLSRTFGNPAFAPYELRKGKRYPTVDIYCLAASLYYAVTGQCPTKSFDRKYDGIELKAPKQLVPSISDALNQAILNGMALEAQDRPQSVQEWLQLLLPQQQTDDLSSDVGVDYAQLRDLLAQGKWKEADKETLLVMLKVAGREQESRLRVSDIEKFPCTDLRTIDTLWVKYSNGRFGFSVQKRIWQTIRQSLQSLQNEENAQEICNYFMGRVGFDRPSAETPEGHFPEDLWLLYFRPPQHEWVFIWTSNWTALMSCIENCHL
jgi:serine/threonine-protein kinase